MMRKLIYILFVVVVSTFWSCARFEDNQTTNNNETTSNVTMLDDGRMMVTGTLSTFNMSEVSVSTRATTTENHEDYLYDAWCMIFGEDEEYRDDTKHAVNDVDYSDNSPLLLVEKITVNANGTFFVVLPQYHGVAFMRVLANLTTRENEVLEDVAAWGNDTKNYYTDFSDPTHVEGIKTLLIPGYTYSEDDQTVTSGTITDAEMTDYGTFGEYRERSVGLDGIYSGVGCATVTINNDGVAEYAGSATSPDPTNLSAQIPMSSVGFVMKDGITETSVSDLFDTEVFLIRVCSKATVTVTDDKFKLAEVYMIGCAQEARIRSTVITSDGEGNSTTSEDLGVPEDLGGVIDYKPLVLTDSLGKGGGSTDPIYFYPNSGGDYDSNNGGVNQSVNPQYMIIKGRAGGYDTDGYYKIALKAKYPLLYEYEDDNFTLKKDNDGNYIVAEWSEVTYDILRNTHFKVDLSTVDKPGYKTYADAANENNPASNISYSITIVSEDGRYETLISNGTYYVELQTTRVYMKGYGLYDEEYPDDTSVGNSGDITFTVYPNSADVVDSEGNKVGDYYHPAVYVMADFGVEIDEVWANEVEQDKVDNTTTDGGFVDGSDDDVHDYWYKVSESENSTKITVKYTAKYSGRIRLRIGDMLKFIPVRYESSPVSGDGGTLKFTTESDVDFSYSKDSDISYLDEETSTKDNSWFSKDAYVSKNETEERELRAMIYPKSSDGILKLYFKQAVAEKEEDFDPNAQTLGDEDILDDGNTLHLSGITTSETGSSGSTLTYSSTTDAAKAIVAMLDKGYETIYFDGDDDDMSITDVLKAVQNNSDYDGEPFSIVITDVTGDWSDGDDFKTDNVDFSGITCISSITLPSDIAKIGAGTFSGCTGLEYVIIGSEDDPTYKFDVVENNSFTGCSKLISITVYTDGDKDTVTVESGNIVTAQSIDEDDAEKIGSVYKFVFD